MSTITPEITTFAAFKRGFKRGFAASLDKSATKRVTPAIAASTVLTAVSLCGRVASAFKGRDLAYVAGARPMTPRRHAQNGISIALEAQDIAINIRTLAARHNRPVGNYGQQNADTTELIGTLIAYVAIGGVAIRELVRGKSMLRSYPTSKYGRVFKAASLVDLGASMAPSGYELYRRRGQWLPELQEHAQTARVMAPVIVSQVKAKVTGKEPEPISVDEDDLERLFAAVLRQGGSVNTNPA